MKAKDLAKTDAARTRRLKAIEAVAVMGMSAKDAAAFSGLTAGSVSSLMARPEVKEYVARLQQEQADKLNVSREEVMQGMLDAIQDAKMLGEPASQIRGWEQIAKMQGYYAPERRVLELPDNARDFIEAMQSLDTAEIARLAGQSNLIELTEEEWEEVDDGH